MSATLQTNGRARKSLAEQIDRLDSVLDGLADNLNEAVAMAVQEAVSAAVRETIAAVLKEVLTNPTFLAALREKHAPAAPAPTRLTAFPVKAAVWTLRLLQRGCQALVNGCQRVAKAIYQTGLALVSETAQRIARVGETCRRLWTLRLYAKPLKKQLLSALAVGGVIGLAVFFADPWVGATLSGLGGFSTALVVQGGWWVRRLLSGFPPTRA